MRLSYSKIKMFKECRKKYFYNYIEKIEPKRKSLALMMGESLQNAIEALYSDFNSKRSTYVDKGGNVNYELMSEALGCIQGQITSYFIDKGIDDPTIIHTVGSMFQGYVKKYYNEDLKDIKEYLPEYECQKELMPGVSLIVKVDGLVKKANDSWWIFENKSTSGDPRKVKTELSYNDQGKTYIYGIDREVKGVVFNIIKKPSIRINKKESVSDFLKRLIDEYILTPEKYILREETYYSAEQMKEFEKDTYQVANDIVNCCAYYRSPSEGCAYCPYEPLCSGYGDYSNYNVKKKV